MGPCWSVEVPGPWQGFENTQGVGVAMFLWAFLDWLGITRHWLHSRRIGGLFRDLGLFHPKTGRVIFKCAGQTLWHDLSGIRKVSLAGLEGSFSACCSSWIAGQGNVPLDSYLWLCTILILWYLLRFASLCSTWSVYNCSMCAWKEFLGAAFCACPLEQACHFIVQILCILNMLNFLASLYKITFRFITFSMLFFHF